MSFKDVFFFEPDNGPLTGTYIGRFNAHTSDLAKAESRTSEAVQRALDALSQDLSNRDDVCQSILKISQTNLVYPAFHPYPETVFVTLIRENPHFEETKMEEEMVILSQKQNPPEN